MQTPSTIPEQIKKVNDMEISYNTLHPKLEISDLISQTKITVPYSSYVSQYREFLSDLIVEEKLDTDRQLKYHFKPKTLSFDLYGTTELWDTILVLNECTSVTTFKPTTVRYYDPDLLKEYLNEIMLLEKAIKY